MSKCNLENIRINMSNRLTGKESTLSMEDWRRQNSHLFIYCLIGKNKLKVLRVNNGEGNGTPPQYSCLENPMDRGAWWAAVYGVAQSQTRLK